MIRHSFVVLGLLVGLTGQGQAQAADPTTDWRSVKVLPKENCVIKVGNETMEQKQLSVPWTVQDVNGEWFLVGDSRKGWVQKSQVVTVDEAPGYYTHLISSNQQNDWAYLHRAVAWVEKGELDLAIADFDEKLRLNPTAATYNNRGKIWHSKKDYDNEIADYNQAIRLDPSYACSYSNRGSVWQSKKEYEKAIADYNQAIRLDPSYANAYYRRGTVWHSKKDYDKAIADCDQAVRLDANHAYAYVGRGLARCAKREYHKAISDFDQAIRLDPNQAEGSIYLAWLLATFPNAILRDGRRAVELATKACELSGWKHSDWIDTLAAAYAETGDFKSAVIYENKAIALDPNAAGFRARLRLFQDGKPVRD